MTLCRSLFFVNSKLGDDNYPDTGGTYDPSNPLIILPTETSGGLSRDIKNLKFKPSKVTGSFLSSVVTALGVVGNPLGSPLLALACFVATIYFSSNLHEASILPISRNEGLVAYVLHCLEYSQDSRIRGDGSVENILKCANIVANDCQVSELKLGDVKDALLILKKINSVRQEGERWFTDEIVILEDNS